MSIFDDDDDRPNMIRVRGDILRETAKAILFRPEYGLTDVWLPLSQIKIDYNASTVSVPSWLAAKNGLE